jgi:hypothetical protein
MKRLFLFPVIIILLFCGCKKENPSPPNTAPVSPIPYWKIGNYWNYLVTSGPNSRYKYVEITKTKLENKGMFSYEFVTQTVIRNYHYVEDGFLKSYEENNGSAISAPYLKLDAKPGDTWGDLYSTYTLESVNDTVKVLAGVYICKKVKEVTKGGFSGPGPGYITYNYYSDQVGLIKCSGWHESFVLSDTNVK